MVIRGGVEAPVFRRSAKNPSQNCETSAANCVCRRQFGFVLSKRKLSEEKFVCRLTNEKRQRQTALAASKRRLSTDGFLSQSHEQISNPPHKTASPTHRPIKIICRMRF